MDRLLQSVRTLQHGVVMLPGRVAIGAAGAVGTAKGTGFTVVKTSTGVYTLTLADSVDSIISARAWLTQASGSAPLYVKTERTATGLVARCYNNPWAGGVAEAEHETFMVPVAGGTNIIGAYGGAHDDAVGPFTQPDVPRNLQIDAAGAGTFTAYGTDTKGGAFTEVKTVVGAGVAVLTKAFATVTRLVGTAGGTWQLASDANTRFGLALGAEALGATLVKVRAAGDDIAAADYTYDAAAGTVGVFAVAYRPNGARDYEVWYTATETGTPVLAHPTSGDNLEFELWLDNTTVEP